MTNTNLSLKWLSPDLKEDFYRVMNDAGHDASNCMCTAYYTSDWEKGGRAWREAMFARGEVDGALLYLGDEPLGWAQCAQLGEKFQVSKNLTLEAGDWGMTCMVLKPENRRHGLGREFFKLLLSDLPSRGAQRIIVVGHKPSASDPGAYIEFPDELCKAEGMELIREHDVCPIYAKKL